ncbi:hypothetical protein H1R20_g3601, partial [Candolleomyces eurysporus]
MVAATLDNTLGAMQIGAMMAMFLFGILTMQFDTYFQLFTDDHLGPKIMVVIVWVLECAHTICSAAEAYRGTITYYGNIAGYQRFPLMGLATVLGALITVIAQCFFALRVWKAHTNPFRYIGAACGVASFVRAIAGIFLGTRFMVAKTLVEYRVRYGWLIRTLLGSGVAIDVVIAVSMLYFLLTKRKSGFTSTTRLVDRLLAYTVRTGLLTSVTAIIVLVTFVTIPDAYIWGGFYVFLAKLYSNSLFSALNERRRLRIIVSEGSSPEMDSRAVRKLTTGGRAGAYSTPAITIEMKTTSVTAEDIDHEKGTPLYSHSRSDEHLKQTSSQLNMEH